MELEGKVALFTGAASGIGESAAELFAKNGPKLCLTDISEDKGQKLVEKINSSGGEAVFFKADASQPNASEESVAATVKKFGKMDIAVNNAGIGGEQAPTGKYGIEAWDKVIAINLSGVFYGIRYQIPEMIQHGNGLIINLASILGNVDFANSAAYLAAKYGVVGLTKSAALEYSAKGNRVNSVGPAFIKTPLLKDLDKEFLDQLVNVYLIGRLGEPEEVAEILLWLASDRPSFATGAYYPIDGGYLAQ